MKKTVILLLILALTLSSLSAPMVLAKDDSPAFWLTFEAIESGKVSDFAGTGAAIDLKDAEKTEGKRGVGAYIGKKGYITSEPGKIVSSLAGASGVTVSAYVKSGDFSEGNILTVYKSADKPGIRLSKSGSKILFSVSSDKNELPKSLEADVSDSFSEWTHVLASADFAGGTLSLYINGEEKASESVNFVGKTFSLQSASLPDEIGDRGLYVDEVRVHPYKLTEGQVQSLIESDKELPEEEGYKDILRDNLVAHFAFDEGEGNVVRSTGKVEIEGHSVSDLDWTEGVHGSAVMFHADSKNYINIGKEVTKALVGKSGLTVSGWFFQNFESGSGYQNRALSLNIDGVRAMFHFTMNSGGIILCATRSDPAGPLTGLNYKPNTADYPFGVWHHITMTTDLKENTIRLFLNGKEQVAMQNGGDPHTNYSQPVFSYAEGANDDTIGGDPTNMAYTMTYNGAIDDLKIYDRAISIEEAEYIYVENKNGSVISRDSEKYAVLRGLTKDTAFMSLGFNEVFADETRVRIDWDDFDAVPVLSGSTTMVPASFAANVLKADTVIDLEKKTAEITSASGSLLFTAESKEYISRGTSQMLSDAPFIKGETMYIPLRPVAELLGKAIYYNDCGLLAVGSNASVKLLREDEDFVIWMQDALTNLPYPQPRENHYATRKVVDFIDASTRIYYTSPSIVRLKDGTLVASHDVIGNGTMILRSKDDGDTWERVRKPDADADNDIIDDTIEEIVYANLFTVTPEATGVETLYLMGVRRGTGDPAAVAIYRSEDGGLTWSVPSDNKTGWLVEDDGTSPIIPAHTAPTPVVRKNGRIYRAFDTSGSGWRMFKVFVMSADENADLLDRDSWTITNPILLSDYASQFPEGSTCTDAGMCEANAVIGPDGGIYVMARFNSAPTIELAAVLKLVDDKTLEFDRIIDFPGGMTKFNVRYDEVSGKWIALSNPNIQPDYVLQRTVLSLLVSDDMYNWRVAETLIVPPWLENWELLTKNIGFQYPDFIFDGDDILYIVREADIEAENYHNANYQTLYKLSDFRKYLD